MTIYSKAELVRRVERVRLLLATMDEPYEGVSSRNERRYKPGLSPGDLYDTGDNAVTFDPAARTRREEAVRVDAEIDRLQEIELVRAGVYAERVEYERVLLAAERRDASGSYRELLRALESAPRTLRGEARIEWLAKHMPRVIRLPRGEHQRFLADLAPAVKELRDDGVGTREIAVRLGVQRGEVRKIIALLPARKHPANLMVSRVTGSRISPTLMVDLRVPGYTEPRRYWWRSVLLNRVTINAAARRCGTRRTGSRLAA